MRKRRLGWTELELSVIGLGTWAHGGSGWRFSWGPQDDRDSIATIHRALDLGVNWVDTAAVYGLGHAEEVLGQALRERRERPIVATKCGLVWDEARHIENRLTRASVFEEAEASLRRLAIDTIDLYQIHWPVPDNEIEEAWEAIDALRMQGKVRYAGVSNFSVDHLRRVGTRGRVASLQPPYSLLKRDAEDAFLPYCARQEIGVVAYSPLQKGLLTGRVTQERAAGLPADDHRRSDPDFQQPRLDVNLRFVHGLRGIASRRDRSVSQLAIAWALRRPEVTSAIVGARRPEQLAETLAAADWQLDRLELAQIEQLHTQREQALRAN